MKELGHAIGVLVLLIQRKILANQSIREVGDQAYLSFRKPLMMERSNLCEVSQVAGDGAFRVVGLLLNLGEGVRFEIQVENLRLMRQPLDPCRVSPRASSRNTRRASSGECHVSLLKDCWLIIRLNPRSSVRPLGRMPLGSIGGCDAV